MVPSILANRAGNHNSFTGTMRKYPLNSSNDPFISGRDMSSEFKQMSPNLGFDLDDKLSFSSSLDPYEEEVSFSDMFELSDSYWAKDHWEDIALINSSAKKLDEIIQLNSCQSAEAVDESIDEGIDEEFSIDSSMIDSLLVTLEQENHGGQKSSVLDQIAFNELDVPEDDSNTVFSNEDTVSVTESMFSESTVVTVESFVSSPPASEATYYRARSGRMVKKRNFNAEIDGDNTEDYEFIQPKKRGRKVSNASSTSSSKRQRVYDEQTKLQNVVAARKYRQRKRSEQDSLDVILEKEHAKKVSLEKTVEELEGEIKIMKEILGTVVQNSHQIIVA